jgi:hypothetical protein
MPSKEFMISRSGDLDIISSDNITEDIKIIIISTMNGHYSLGGFDWSMTKYSQGKVKITLYDHNDLDLQIIADYDPTILEIYTLIQDLHADNYNN